MVHYPTRANPYTRRWLWLAVAAIGLSALFAALLVVARTPLLQQLFGGADLFHTVLVLHVNFSVLIWLLASGAMLWSLTDNRSHPLIAPFAFGLAVAGAMLLGLSPLLTPPPQPVMSNYIPVLHSPAFLTGLCAFATGIALAALSRLLTTGGISGRLAALALLCSLSVFAISAWRLSHPIDTPAAFEALFWGGGHLLQFTYLLLLFEAWERLQPTPHRDFPRSPLIVVTLAALLTGFVLALWFEPGSTGSREGYTWLMRIATPLLALPAIARQWNSPHTASPLRLSQWLLLAGLLLGLAISGDNVSVTAHYHATNAAITLAFMALAYRLFARLGLGQPAMPWARHQLRAYFAGMTVYISGMALSGMLDVPRKVPAHTDGLQALAMGLMGIGGLVAIAASLLFAALLLHAGIQRQWSRLTEEQHEAAP